MTKLYDNLMKLCNEDEKSFYFKDFVTSMHTNVRIFNYRFASYSDWIKPDALEARGIMFNQDTKEIMCRPMEKFFNVNENPLSTIEALGPIDKVYEKLDGSLISSFMDEGYLFFKSKTSLYSEQAEQASILLNSYYEYQDLKEAIIMLEKDGFTVNLEYTAPSNQVVILYDKPKLTVLNARHRETGVYLPYSDLFAIPGIRGNEGLVEAYMPPENNDPKGIEEYIKTIKKEENTEGVILLHSNGTMSKVKTDWYLTLHRAKDSLNSDKQLIHAIVEEVEDDLYPLISTNIALKEKLDAYKEHISQIVYNYYIDVVDFYKSNIGLTRKDYAIKAQTLMPPEMMNPCMKMYQTNDENLILELVKQHVKKYAETYTLEKYKNIQYIDNSDN